MNKNNLLLIFLILTLVNISFGLAPLLTKIEKQNQFRMCTMGKFNITLTGIGFVNNKQARCRFSSNPVGTNVTTPVYFTNSTSVQCEVPDRVANSLTLDILLSVSNDGIEYSNNYEIKYSGTYPWTGNVFLTGHDPDFHGFTGSGNGLPLLIQSLEFSTKKTWNNLAAPGRKKFLYIESKLPKTGSDVKASLPTFTNNLNLTVGIHFDHVNDVEFATAKLSDYSALVIASAGGGLLTTREIRALNARKQDIAYFLKNGGGMAAYAEGIGSFTVTKNIAGISDCLVSEAFAFLPITVEGSPLITQPYSVTPRGVELFNLTVDQINDPSHSIFSQTGGLEVITYDSKNKIVTLAGQINPCTNDCNGNGDCTCGECFCEPGWSGPFCECHGSDTCEVCGDGIVQGGEQCDSGLGCNSSCKCADGYEITEPISKDCQKLLPPRVTTATPTPTNGGSTTLTGVNFGVDDGAIQVNINNKPCTNILFVPNTNNGKISCIAPEGFGINWPISINASGRIGDGVNQTTFSYLPPTTTSASQAETNGGSITIQGTNFGNQINQVKVTVDGAPCVVTSVAHTSLVCTVGSGSGINKPVAVQVSTLSTPSTGGATFSYIAPTITMVTNGATEGGEITIVGKSFGEVAPLAVTITGGPTCSSPKIIVNHTMMVCSVSQGSGAKYPIKVTVDGLTSGPAEYSYIGPAIMHKLAKPPTKGNYTIVIMGNDFGIVDSDVSVQIDDNKSCTDAKITIPHREITCTVPEGTGSHLVSVKVNGQTSFPIGMTYQDPTISRTSNPLTSGSTITLLGDNFGTNNSLITVKIKSVICSNPEILKPHTLLVCLAPPGFGFNLVDIEVDTLHGSGNMTYAGPSLRRAYPPLSTVGGDILTLIGTNFGTNSSLATVNLNRVPCTNVNIINDTVLTCVSPPGTGYPFLQVEIGDEYIASGELVRYTESNVYSITSAPTSGGYITLTGDNFGNDRSLLAIQIGDDRCGDVKIEEPHTKLSCEILPGRQTEPLIQVVVIVDSNRGNPNNLFVFDSPVVETTTTVGAKGGRITLTGTSFGMFTEDIIVHIDTKECTNVQIVYPHTSISCDLTGGKGFYLNANVTVSGKSSPINDLFSYDDGAVCDDPTCSGHGQCVGGVCDCNHGYFGPTCAIKKNDTTLPEQPVVITPNTTNPDAKIVLPTNETINIYVKEVRERTGLNETIKSYQLNSLLWNLTTDSNEETLHWNYSISLDSGQTVLVQIHYFLKSKSIEFAKQNLSMQIGTVKFSIDVIDWKFANKLNSLDVIMSAVVQGEVNPCATPDDYGIVNNEKGDNLHWLQFNQNGNTLYGRFSNRAITDERIIPITQKIENKSEDGKSMDFSMTVPNFEKKAQIDPDFSVLLGKSTIKSNCGSEEKFKWWIPVSVVGSVAVAGAAVGTAIYKRKLIRAKMYDLRAAKSASKFTVG